MLYELLIPPKQPLEQLWGLGCNSQAFPIQWRRVQSTIGHGDMRDDFSAIDPRSWFRSAPKNGSAGAGADDDLDIYEPADGSAHPKPDGLTQLSPHVNPYVSPYGISHGNANGLTSATNTATPTAEEILGVRFYKDHRGVVQALQPGQEPPLEPEVAVSSFIAWLQNQPPFPGSEIEAGLIRDKLWPAFCCLDDRIPELAWSEVSGLLVALGCKKRQPDGRCGAPKDGVQSPVLYRIPAPARRRRKANTRSG